MLKRCLGLTAMLLFSGVGYAEVVRSTASGFEIRIEVTVKASAEAAYDQFLKVADWWSPDHTWFGKAAGLTIEPRAGGCFCERDGARSALHMLVSYVDPGREMRLIGGLGPLQGLGLDGPMSWTFESLSAETSRIIQVYRVNGDYPGKLDELAQAVDSVQTLQLERLQMRLSSR